jgi:hypothetical protein
MAASPENLHEEKNGLLCQNRFPNPHFSPLAQETSAGFFLPKFAKKQPSASTLLPA